MVQSIQFPVDEFAAETKPASIVLSSLASKHQATTATAEIEERVTLSPQSAAVPPSSLLPFAETNAAASSRREREAANNLIPPAVSRLQQLLDEGYSLSEISHEFNLPLVEVESDSGPLGFSTAA